ncbi:MAG: hypothetical protein ACTSW5_00070 [Promethearchaeota archaeon]
MHNSFNSYKKKISDPILSQIWVEITKLLNNATEIIFVGYFLPDADYMSKNNFVKVLQRYNYRECVDITIVNPDSHVSEKFQSIFGDIPELID